MNLEEIVSIGKKEGQLNESARKFHENPYTNIIPEILKIDGTSEWLAEEGIDRITAEEAKKKTPAEINDFVNMQKQMYAGELATKVQEDYEEAVGYFGEEDEGVGLMVELISGIEPREHNGANGEIREAHERVYYAFNALQNPEEGFESLLEGKEETLAGQALMFLVAKNPRFAQAVLSGRVRKATEKLYESLGNGLNAREYLKELYTNSDDEGKKEIAYKTGKILSKMAS